MAALLAFQLKSCNPNGQQHKAKTNEDKSNTLAKTFFPPMPNTTTVLADYLYPELLPNPTPITEDQLLWAINKLSAYKAPGPDEIPNAMFKNCSNVLTPHLLCIYRAVFLLNTYYPPWQEFNTMVQWKPRCPDYLIPKAYKLIALLNTTAKLLTSIITDHMSHIIETHHLLPTTHFGGRPGQSTTDSLHLLKAMVKNAWCTHKIASTLFLNIEGAFHTVIEHLLHNMQCWKIPDSLVNFTEWVLLNRKTKLMFDGHKSDWIPITNGIGQGNPLCMIIYIIYNTDLINIAQGHPNELTLAFVNDTIFITTGKSTKEMHCTLQDMLEQTEGGLDWSFNHNSKFKTNKFALIDFTPTKQSSCPLNVWRTTIMPSISHKFLGVIIDECLSWHQYINYTISKGTPYTLQLCRLATASKGLCYDFFPFPCLFPRLCSMTPLLLFRSLLPGDQPIPTHLPWLLFSSPVSSLVSLCSTGLSHSLVTSLMVTMFPPPSIEFYDLLLR